MRVLGSTREGKVEAATKMRLLRKIAGVTRLARVRNDTVKDRLRLEPVL